MSLEKVYLAVDLGAESGRVVAGRFNGERIALEEIHRFPNLPVKLRGSLHWDVLGIFAEIKKGLALAARAFGTSLVSMGVDTWGVDYGMLDAHGDLVGNPYHYRDSRTDGMMEEAYRRVPKKEIYRQTGIQFMFFNTIFQILSEVVREAPGLGIADRLLFTPDLFHYWLTGAKVNERTIASTSQLYDPTDAQWAVSLAEDMGIPSRLFGEIVSPGTRLGSVLPEISLETGTGPLEVIAPGCHDTASAVAAVPATGESHAYLSSGTWSLMGIESPVPIITDRSFDYGFTNEIGVCDTVRVLKNISGLWLVQESRRTWAARGEDLGYEELTLMAGDAPPFAAMIDPDCPVFASPGDMPARIEDFCRRTGQRAPSGKGSLVRTILECLAFRYRSVLQMLEELSRRRLEPLHIVGGGSRNRLLNQFAANVLNRTVIAGPVEATSAGNIVMQLIGKDELKSLSEGRELIRRSFDMQVFSPSNPGEWEDAYGRYREIEGK